MGSKLAEECCCFLAGELQEVWKQAEYSTLRKENTQCITNVPDTEARFLPAQVEVSEVKYFYTFLNTYNSFSVLNV